MENQVPSPQHNRYSKAYFAGLLLSLVIIWLPFKALAYFAPFIFIILFIIRANSGKTLYKLLLLSVITGFIIAGYSIFYHVIDKDFIIQNAILSILTYGSFLVLVVLPVGIAGDRADFRHYAAILKLLIVLQSIIGLLQVTIHVIAGGVNLDLSAGDMAQGTLNLLSFLNPGGNLNNQIFASNLILMLIFYAPYTIARKRDRWISLLGLAAILVSSVWHLLIAFLAATMLTIVYFSRSTLRLSGSKLLITFLVLLVVGAAYVVQPKNFSLITHYYNSLTSLESPKASVSINSITELPKDYPWVYIFGLGPGQYSSRAGLIGTGHYFGDFANPTKLPILVPQSSEAFDKFVFPSWTKVATNPETYGNSTMSRPFYSAMSLLIEFGPIVFIIIVIGITRSLGKLKKMYRHSAIVQDREGVFITLSCGIAILYLCFISFFENYLEVAHAIFIGILLIRYSYAQVMSAGKHTA